MERKIKVNGIYRHFKGNYYIVIDIGKDTETEGDVVIYRALYGDNQLWVRPLDMFLSKVDKKKYPDVMQEYRFELQDFNKDYVNK